MALSKTLKLILFLLSIAFALIFHPLYSVDYAILYKSCFLSFEQHDISGAMTRGLRNCISQKVISIVVPQVLGQMKYDKHFLESYQSGKIMFLASEFTTNDGLPQLIVIIPASLEDLGIKITESEKQKKESLIAAAVASKYGFKNLYLLKPEFGWPIIEKVNRLLRDEFDADIKNFPKIVKRDSPELKKILENFPNIIDRNLPQHPTRFYLSGHGEMGVSIAGIPIKYFEILLSDFS